MGTDMGLESRDRAEGRPVLSGLRSWARDKNDLVEVAAINALRAGARSCADLAARAQPPYREAGEQGCALLEGLANALSDGRVSLAELRRLGGLP